MITDFLGYLRDVWNLAIKFVSLPFYAETEPGWHFILRIFLITVFFCGSAFLAATVAEVRRHKVRYHFLLGLIFPYIYPLVLAFILKTRQEAEDAEDEIDPLSGLGSSMTDRLKSIQSVQKADHDKRIKRVRGVDEETETEVQSEEPETIEPEAVEEIPEGEGAVEVEEAVPQGGFNQRYFQSIAVDSSGAKAGPFKMEVANGTEFTVCSINTIQENIASFEIDVKGKTKNIRVKYDNIVSFDKI
jgi:Ca2+/Na+ antiporter